MLAVKTPSYIKFLLVISSIFCLDSCSKTEGEGGTSSIKGRVYAKYYNKQLTTLHAEKYAPEEDVYIIYGDEVTFGDNQNTNFDGYYEFKFLRPGKYKIYSYSRDTAGASIGAMNQNAPNVAIIQEIEITKRGQVITATDLAIIK